MSINSKIGVSGLGGVKIYRDSVAQGITRPNLYFDKTFNFTQEPTYNAYTVALNGGFLPYGNRSGWVLGGWTTATGGGLLDGGIIDYDTGGTITRGNGLDVGPYTRFPTAGSTGDIAGFSTTTGVVYGQNSPSFAAKFRIPTSIADMNLQIGFINADPVGTTWDTIFSSLTGFMFGFDNTDTNVRYRLNDGTGTGGQGTTSVPKIADEVYFVSAKWYRGDRIDWYIKCPASGGLTENSGSIPSTDAQFPSETDALNFHMSVTTTTTTAVNLDVFLGYIEIADGGKFSLD